jgi:N-succinyldiaminopimelate aminotransferase
MIDGLAAAGFEVYRPAGTYFITTDIRPFGEVSGLDFCRKLPHKAGVVAIPSAVFYDNAGEGQFHVRFAFCKKEEVLKEALNRLSALRSG